METFGPESYDFGLAERQRQEIQRRKDEEQQRKDEFRPVDPTGALGGFAGQGLQGYANGTTKMDALGQMLLDRANGKDSLSAEQLRQSLGQTLAAQRSFAAGARPGNQAMAARTAATNMGRQQSGLAGAQATAGIQERNAALGQLGGLYSTQRAQDIQAGLGGAGAIEGSRTSRYGVDNSQPREPSAWEKALGAVGQGAKIYSSF